MSWQKLCTWLRKHATLTSPHPRRLHPCLQLFLQRCIRHNADPEAVADHWMYLAGAHQAGHTQAIHTWVAVEIKALQG